ncbi:hypothetical protein EGW08_023304 [Elysia chlorotica]|uniref:Protein kinase domain-containing protein n=1 Tax=Elysia chlorotica TaxID=188477 RepID=A0A433SIX7_ELYCH|nr:hypothetical protein EGW08_023304 [Elysia chlorotica]
MAESVNPETSTTIYDLEGEDFFQRFNLKKVKSLGRGMSGEVFLVKSKSGSGRMLAVKTFSLSEDVRERSMRQFSTEAGVMQAVTHDHLVPCVMAARCHDYEQTDRQTDRQAGRDRKAVTHHLVPCVMAARCHDYAAIAMPYYPRGDLVELSGQQETSCDIYAIGVMYWALVSGEDPETGTDYLGKVRAAKDLSLTPSQRSTLERLLSPNPEERPTASQLDESKTALAGLVGGTRGYWSPEKLEAGARDRIDPFKCDIYALGVMYWALVSGEDPETGTDYLGKVRARKDLSLSPSQRSTLERSLSPNPEERPTASQLVRMIHKK